MPAICFSLHTIAVLSPHHCIGNPLQFLFKPSRVFMSSSLNVKSNNWERVAIKRIKLLIRIRFKAPKPSWPETSRWTCSFWNWDWYTWKFSLIRWGVTDFAMTITFLWMWNLMRTWHRNQNIKQYSASPTCFCGHIYSLVEHQTLVPHDSAVFSFGVFHYIKDFIILDKVVMSIFGISCVPLVTQIITTTQDLFICFTTVPGHATIIWCVIYN